MRMMSTLIMMEARQKTREHYLRELSENGGRGFKASMQKVAFTICPYYMLHYEFVRSRDGIQGYGYGTVPRYGMVPYVPT